ncbi:hypothetical protein MMC13_000049 [Lambiella insularis]|nr:hypothetical protein [Lambiella insularis]
MLSRPRSSNASRPLTLTTSFSPPHAPPPQPLTPAALTSLLSPSTPLLHPHTTHHPAPLSPCPSLTASASSADYDPPTPTNAQHGPFNLQEFSWGLPAALAPPSLADHRAWMHAPGRDAVDGLEEEDPVADARMRMQAARERGLVARVRGVVELGARWMRALFALEGQR